MTVDALRGSLSSGDIKYGDLLTTIPFDDVVSTFQIKGGDLVTALSFSIKGVVQGAFLQVAGIQLQYNPVIRQLISVDVRTFIILS